MVQSILLQVYYLHMNSNNLITV